MMEAQESEQDEEDEDDYDDDSVHVLALFILATCDSHNHSYHTTIFVSIR